MKHSICFVHAFDEGADEESTPSLLPSYSMSMEEKTVASGVQSGGFVSLSVRRSTLIWMEHYFVSARFSRF